MSGIPFNLFLAMIILTCVILLLVLVLLLNHCIKRHDQQTSPSTLRDVEDLHSDPEQAIHDPRPQIQHDHYMEQQRLSHLTTITPSIELLPEIRTSTERAENWLERKDSRFAESDIVKTQRVPGVKSEGALKWDWRTEQLRGGVHTVEKDGMKDDGPNDDSTEKK